MMRQEEIQETLLRLCKHYGEQNWWQSDNKLEDLVSTILIQRTSEKNIKLALAGLMDIMAVEGILGLSLEDLRKQLLELKGIGSETADALLLYFFDRSVFISDEYAIRLFRRLGGNFDTYNEMQAVYCNVLEGLTLKQCQEIHAVIDEHGKGFSKSKGQLDECWLR